MSQCLSSTDHNKSSLEHIPRARLANAVQVMLTISAGLVLRMNRRIRAYMQWARLMGVATMGNKDTFVTLVDRAEQIEAHLSQLFADFDMVIALITR